MVVIYKNDLYTLNMRYCIFESLKKSNPDMVVEIETLTSSTYKQVKEVPLSDLFDYSIERNLNALRN